MLGLLAHVDAQTGARPRISPWRQVETESFVIHTCSPDIDLATAARKIEQTRAALAGKWFGPETPAWQPKCMVLLCPTVAVYRSVVGPGSEQTAGSSLVDIAHGKVRSRRIELRLDRHGWQDAALPHELMHVLLADRFLPGRPPRWAEEGLALLVDSRDKRALHQRDLQTALRDGQAFRLGELLTRETYPAAERWPAFYGQSLSLVEFLVARGAPQKFTAYMSLAQTRGQDAALREVYGIADVGALEQQWRASLNKPAGQSPPARLVSER